MKPMWSWALPMSLISLAIGFDTSFWPGDKEIPLPDPVPSATPEEVVQCRTYRLPDAQWLNLDLPSNSERIRFLINGALAPEVLETLQPGLPPTEYPLTFDYEVLNRDGELLQAGQSVFHARLNGLYDEAEQAARLGGFFKQSKLLPGTTHEISMSLARFEGHAARVRVRLGTHAAEVREAVLRSYALVGRRENPDSHLWDRTSPTWRERLTRTNLYPPELVSESERRNLLVHRWSALPPSGIDGVDYEEQILCLFRQFSLPPEIEAVTVWEGHPVAPHWRGSIPLPDPQGHVRLEFHWHELTEPLPGETPAPVRVRWFGPRSDQRITETLSPASDTATVELPVAGGMLDVECPHVAEVRAWWRPAGGSVAELLAEAEILNGWKQADLAEDGSIDITPQPLVRRAYGVESGQALEFSITHLPGEATPLRLILQELLTTDTPAAAGEPELVWEFLDQTGSVRDHGKLTLWSRVSEYDRADERVPAANVAESVTRYFSVPPDISAFRLRSAGSAYLVSAATRPPDLPLVRQVGDDLGPLDETPTDRAWFPLIPDNDIELAEQGRRHQVFIRRQPPEDDPEARPRRWNSLTPTTAWTGRRLLVPWEPSTEFRPELCEHVFQRLETGVPCDTTLVAPQGARQVAPQLVFTDVPRVPQTLSVLIDGQLHEQVRIVTPQGKVTLSPIAVRGDLRCRIELRTDDAFPIWMNNLRPGAGPSRLQRFALRWNSAELEFEFDKQSAGEECLQMKLFQGRQAADGSTIRCELVEVPPRAAGPFESWTLTQRILQLQPAAESAAIVLEAGGERVQSERVCVIPFGSDLPPGRYRLRLRRESGDLGYVLLFQESPDSGDVRSFEVLSGTERRTAP